MNDFGLSSWGIYKGDKSKGRKRVNRQKRNSSTGAWSPPVSGAPFSWRGLFRTPILCVWWRWRACAELCSGRRSPDSPCALGDPRALSLVRHNGRNTEAVWWSVWKEYQTNFYKKTCPVRFIIVTFIYFMFYQKYDVQYMNKFIRSITDRSIFLLTWVCTDHHALPSSIHTSWDFRHRVLLSAPSPLGPCPPALLGTGSLVWVPSWGTPTCGSFPVTDRRIWRDVWGPLACRAWSRRFWFCRCGCRIYSAGLTGRRVRGRLAVGWARSKVRGRGPAGPRGLCSSFLR